MSENVNFILQVFIAVGTVGAVIVALFKDYLKPRPKLSMGISNPKGYIANRQSNSDTNREPARYYHLRVENHRRWASATSVQVYLTHIQKMGSDSKYKTVWLGELPMRWRYQETHPIQRVIGPVIECDLCSVVRGKFVQLLPLIYPDEFQHQWEPKVELVLTLQARSVEKDSSELYVGVSWDGEWEDGEVEMSRHMIVEKVVVREDGTVDA